MNRFRLFLVMLFLLGVSTLSSSAAEEISLWNGNAPGETTSQPGVTLPRRPNENPPATRIKDITRPTLQLFKPQKPNGTAVIVCPGGGYNYVVVDKEGSEIARWLNKFGVTTFVLKYRTKDGQTEPIYRRPLQDGERAMRLVRSRAAEWKLNPDRIGIMGFSAGGQLAALVSTRFNNPSYEAKDSTDQVSSRPDFTLLIYPWQLVGKGDDILRSEFEVGDDTPPAFLAHTHDDGVTSLSSVAYYELLIAHGVDAQLHIFENGGHGYGMRAVQGSFVSKWPSAAEYWLRLQALID